MPAAPVIVTREMGIGHRDFYRIFPAVIDHRPFEFTAAGVKVRDGARCLEIALGAEGIRRIAQLRVPFTTIRLTFHGYTRAELQVFLARFDRHFHRGGG